MIDLNHVKFDPEEEKLMEQARLEVAADSTVRHAARIYPNPFKQSSPQPTLTDEQQARMESALQAVHTSWAAIRAELVELAAAGDTDAAEMLARGDAYYERAYGYAPGQRPATTLTEPPTDEQRGDEIEWTDEDEAAADRAWRELDAKWRAEDEARRRDE
jgi:hypothetical protein